MEVLKQPIIAFDRTHTIYIVFQPRGFYDVLRVLIADVRSFQALAAILDWLTHLAKILCWYHPIPGKMTLDYLKLLCYEFQKYKVMTMAVVGGQPKKQNNKTHQTHFSNLWLLLA